MVPPAGALRVLAFIPVLLSLAAAGPARSWTWFPAERTLQAPLADPREPGLGFAVVEDAIISARVGHAFALGRTGNGGGSFEIGLDGSAWLWFSSHPRLNFPLETVDGTFGVWAGARGERLGWRVRLSHWSGHLGDGASMIEARRIVYSRESLGALVFLEPNPHLELYAGPALFVRADPPTQAFQFQLGGELRPDRGIRRATETRAAHVDPFLALDFRAKAENGLRLNQSYRAGVRLAGAPGGNALRIALGYDAGKSERGQEHRRTERFISLGMSFGE